MDSVLVVGRLFFSPLIARASLLLLLLLLEVLLAVATADPAAAATDVVDVIMADTDDALPLLLVLFV